MIPLRRALEMHEGSLLLSAGQTLTEGRVCRYETQYFRQVRFVLDHRLQQLMEEKGPITAHIEGLEAYIRGMDDELVRLATGKTSR